MRILLTIHQFFPHYSAGTEQLTYSVAHELLKRGHEVCLLTGYPGSKDLSEEDRFDEYTYEGIYVYRFHHAYTPMAGQYSCVELSYDNQLAVDYLVSVMQKFKPDIVHFFHLDRLGSGLIDVVDSAGVSAFFTPTDFWIACPTGQLLLSNNQLCAGPSIYAGNCVKHFAVNKGKGLIKGMANLIPVSLFDLLSNWTASGYLPSYPHNFEVEALRYRLEKNISRLGKLKKIFSPSHFMTELLIKYGVDSSLIIQSSFGVDVPVSDEKRSHSLIPSRPFCIGFIGTLAEHKGCHVLIDAFNKLSSGLAMLKIYGNPDEFPEYTELLVKNCFGNSSIEFCGEFPNVEMSDVLSGLDVLVVPSIWYENTPLVVYSAQAMSCPVVASNLPGMSEIIQDEVNGLLFETGNSFSLLDVLHRLITEQGLVERLSARSVKPKTTSAYVDELLQVWRVYKT